MTDAEAALLDWSAKQGRILTGDGRLNELYQPPRHVFFPDELPHHYLARGPDARTPGFGVVLFF